jgi:OOP family OmpA-OmpF porin
MYIKASAEEFIPTPEKPVILEGVNFESNKAILLENSKQILDRVAASLLAHPDVKVEVAGHCDATGTDEYNLKLSRARANTVRDYLSSKGIPAAQLTVKGYGESQPITDNKTAEGRAKNRRVELKRM